MFNRERSLHLALRQRELVLHSAQLRGELLHDLQSLQAPLALADRVRSGWAWLRAHPQAPLAALVVLVLLRPRRVLRWGARLWWGWRMWRRMRPVLATVWAGMAQQGMGGGTRRPR